MAKKATQQDQPQPRTVVYVGPNLHKGKLTAFSIFKGGLPPHVKALADAYPEINRMLVPTSDFAAVRKAAEAQGTEEHRVYQALKALRFKEE